MLSVAKMRMYGMRDERWTVQDKLAQIHGIINLHKREHEQVEYNVSNLRKMQSTEIRQLNREVREYRGLLDTARLGDKQRLRNILRAHRPTQIAFMEQRPEKVLDHLEQTNFKMSKEMNRLEFLRKQRMSTLLHLQLDARNLQCDKEKREKEPTTSPVEQALTSQLNTCVVKQNAATAVAYTYQNVKNILKKDTLYFDAILDTLHQDSVTQCRCLIKVTEMGQMATEDLARIRNELQLVEADVKCSMQDRSRAVAALRAHVEQNHAMCKNFVRVESEEDLRLGQVRVADSTEMLLKELNAMEDLMQKLQGTTLVSTYMDIFPRFKDQLRQRQRLVQQVAQRERRRDAALTKRNHSQLMLHTLQHTMSTTAQGFKLEKEELLTKTAAEMEREKENTAQMHRLGVQMVAVRSGLFTISAVLNQIKPVAATALQPPKEFEWTVEEEFMDSLYARKYGPKKAPENNAMVQLKNIYSKVGVLLEQLKASTETNEVPDHLIRSRRTLPDVILEKPKPEDPAVETIGALVLDTELEDTSVPTRASIKLQSSKIVEHFERPPEVLPVNRIRRVRKEEKWI